MAEQTTTKPTPEQHQEEVWAFGGLRAGADGKRLYAWLPEAGAGRTVYFPRFHGQAVGELYRVTVERRDGGRLSVLGSPRYAGDGRVDAETAAHLRAEHHAASTILALARRHRSAARRNELDELIYPLRTIAARLSRPERTALIAYVITELTYPRATRAGGEQR
ncbi:MAG: hypothetical protein J2P15_08710 [Micromonosporaceae bacterium]|nr:hypothetical protein [Micromonosporaceae bacterium]